MKDDPKQTAGNREYHKLDNGNLRFVFVVEADEKMSNNTSPVGRLLKRLWNALEGCG